MHARFYRARPSHHLDSRYPATVIRQAVNRILEQEQALRLCITHDAEGFSQYERPYSPVLLPVIDAAMEEPALMDHFKKEMDSFSFALDTPLYSFCLARSRTCTALRAFFHHIVIDGMSIGIFGHLLSQYCRQIFNRQEPPRVSHSFLETVDQERALLTDEMVAEAKAFWRNRFAAHPPAFCRVSAKSEQTPVLERGERIARTLPLETARRINAYCGQKDISPAVLFQAALVLYLRGKNPEISRINYGAMVSNRVGLVQKSMLGNFALELLHSVPLPEDDTADALYDAIKTASAEAFRHAACSYEDTLEIAREQDETVETLRDVQFVYLPPTLPQGRAFDIHWLPNYCPETSLECIVLNMADKEEFFLVFDYRPSAFSREEAEAAMNETLAFIDLCMRNSAVGVNAQPEEDACPTTRDLIGILRKYTSAPAITPVSRLGSDLHLDSFDVISLVSEVEETFHIALTDEDFQRWVAVQDVVDFIKQENRNA